MELIADILLVAGALGAGLYCFVLARRLSRFNDLEKGVGGAVAMLSAQVDDLSRTIADAKNASGTSSDALDALTRRAEAAAQKLELIMASMHDMPDVAAASPPSVPQPAEAAEPLTGPRPESLEEPLFTRRARINGGARNG